MLGGDVKSGAYLEVFKYADHVSVSVKGFLILSWNYIFAKFNMRLELTKNLISSLCFQKKCVQFL